VTQLQWPSAGLYAVPPSRRAVREQTDQPAYVPHPLVIGLSGDYRGADHSEQNQHKLYLQETPAGLLFDLFAHEPHPTRSLAAERSGIAKKVAEGVFAHQWESEDEDGKPVPAWFYIVMDASGKVDVSIRGTVARNPPFYTERDLEGTYYKVGPEAEMFDEAAIQAVACLQAKERSGRREGASLDDCQRAAHLLGGGDALASVFFKQAEKAAAFAVDICSARQGNEYALQTVLLTLGGVRGGTAIDPGFALKVYETAKETNPGLSDIYERPESDSRNPLKRELTLIKLATECPSLDFDAFLRKNGISETSLDDSAYAIWELAEDAALGKRFGKPNAELAFQLVLRGGGSFDERAAAIRLAHSAWMSAGKERFSLAACLSSPTGGQYLRRRGKSKDSSLLVADLRKKIRNPSVQSLLEKAVEAQANFIAENARIYCGNGEFGSWELNSAAYEKRAIQEYLERVVEVLKGFKPKKDAAFGRADSMLNAKYKRAVEGLANREAVPEEDPEGGASAQFFYRNVDALKKVQRAWLPARDSSALLFNALSPAVSVEEWKEQLTVVRMRELPAFKQPAKPQ
jgi:uncharacterized protein YecT (DUF1311 family)